MSITAPRCVRVDLSGIVLPGFRAKQQGSMAYGRAEFGADRIRAHARPVHIRSVRSLRDQKSRQVRDRVGASLRISGAVRKSPIVNRVTEEPASSSSASADRRGILFDLLAYSAATSSARTNNRISAQRLQEFDDRQIQWVFDAGLAPLLHRALGNDVEQLPPSRRDALRSADLTARVRHGSLVDAAVAIIDTCQELDIPVTLLKGISISDQFYPEAHLRPMGDIDILVPQEAYALVEAALLRQGYVRHPNYPVTENSHHGVPLFHAERRVWVEIHTSLFPKNTSLQKNTFFDASNVAALSCISPFHGRRVSRLTIELQLAYIASFWIRDLCQEGIQPSYVPPVFDAIYLLKASGGSLRWTSFLERLDNESAILSLYILLTYLSRRDLFHVYPDVLARLASAQRIIGPMELKIIHGMFDNNLIGGKPFTKLFQSWHVLHNLLVPGSHTAKLLALPWRIVFPPRYADRYGQYQLARITRRVRGER